MIDLARCVRFCVPLGVLPSALSPRHNTYAAWPSMPAIGAYYELEVRCRGRADARTGYLVNIAHIDAAVRTHGIPVVTSAVRERPDTHPARVLADVLRAIAPHVQPPPVALTWRLTPYYAVRLETTTVDRFLVSQQFEFAAAHRLHVPSLSDEENRTVFGKCNNPNGHGHNYRVEVAASAPLPAGDAAPSFTLPELERIVDEHVIKRFDHKHLNLDTEEFVDVNPSVEHITRACHDRLAGPLEAAGARLERVTVWETEKTSCTYPAGSDR